jgi:FlaA1/EpsC-like NDP-sugar epimerase
LNDYFGNKRVLVTGSCGTIGKELVRQLVEVYGVKELVGLDNNESELFFQEQTFLKHGHCRFFLSDIRDRKRLSSILRSIDIVFHTAAFKHVSLCERSPMEAVNNNILGVQAIIESALECGVEKVIFTSSDKAVNPTNVMGTSKLMGERLMTAANSTMRGDGTVFASTRFGNVLGSRGSVLPIFREQIRRGGPVTVTDQEMTRFIMSIEQATRLVIDSEMIARGGEVFITKMPVIRIMDLAEVMIEELAPGYGHDPEKIGISYIGTKPGEKMYEELMSMEETRRAVELEDYFAVLPAFRSLYNEIRYDYKSIVSDTVTNPYHSGSEAGLSKAELKEFLLGNGLLDEGDPARHPDERHWP